MYMDECSSCIMGGRAIMNPLIDGANIKERGKENAKKIAHQTSFHESDFLTLCSLLDDSGEIICHHKF